MVTLNEVIKVFAINGRGADTEGTRSSGVAEEIIERFVVEAKCSMDAPNMPHDRLIWMEPLTLVIIWPREVNARVN